MGAGGGSQCRYAVGVEGRDPDLVSDAIVLWLGFRIVPWPQRDESRVVERFGMDGANALLPLVRALEDEFYESDARHIAADVKAMGEQASAEFRVEHPELSDDAVAALAWAYTFDFK